VNTEKLSEGQTDLVQAPPLLEWSERATTFMVIVLDITVAISCLQVSSCSDNAL
jgi:hypothetical protein